MNLDFSQCVINSSTTHPNLTAHLPPTSPSPPYLHPTYPHLTPHPRPHHSLHSTYSSHPPPQSHLPPTPSSTLPHATLYPTYVVRQFCNVTDRGSTAFNIIIRPYSIDFTLNFNNERFSIIDHFIVPGSVFKFSINSVCVIHEVDNLSDHKPLLGLFKFSNELVSVSTARNYFKRFSWYKATKQTFAIFKFVFPWNSLKSTCLLRLYRVAVLIANNVNHHNALSKFCEDIYKCCFTTLAVPLYLLPIRV